MVEEKKEKRKNLNGTIGKKDVFFWQNSPTK